MNVKKYRNVGGIDRVIRVITALVLIYFGFINTALIGQALLATLIGIFGIVNILAAIIGICPVYAIAGINTCPARKT